MLLKLTTLLTLVAISTAQAQVYRCEQEGIIIFSDSPCAADAVSYTPAGSVSVIPRANDLDQVEAANRAFIEAQMERQASERQIRRERAARHKPAAGQSASPPVNPVFVLPRKAHGPGYQRHHPPHQSTKEEERRQQPFSALSGPWPGSRRPSRSPP